MRVGMIQNMTVGLLETNLPFTIYIVFPTFRVDGLIDELQLLLLDPLNILVEYQTGYFAVCTWL